MAELSLLQVLVAHRVLVGDGSFVRGNLPLGTTGISDDPFADPALPIKIEHPTSSLFDMKLRGLLLLTRAEDTRGVDDL